jgi:3-dehydroquinate synthase
MHSSPTPKYDFLQQEKPVYSGADALTRLERWLTLQKNVNRIAVLCDTHTSHACLPILLKVMPASIPVAEIVIEPGEHSKSLLVCQDIWQRLTQMEIGREDLLINLGGGVVSDIGGFVAAAYLRGLRFVNVPTSLMAMTDAGLGGKTGVDLDHIKNRIGTISFPECTVCFPGFLETLPEVEWKSGAAEVFKHALIADPDLWKALVAHGCTRESLAVMLQRIQRVKMEVVHIDPYEKGLRKILNFGHSIGHAIESQSLSSSTVPLTHGQSVAIGMMIETEISLRMQKLSNGEAEEIIQVLSHYFGKVNLSDYSVSDILKWMRYDKKNHKGEVKMSLLTGIGSCDWNIPVDENLMADVLVHFGAKNK